MRKGNITVSLGSHLFVGKIPVPDGTSFTAKMFFLLLRPRMVVGPIFVFESTVYVQNLINLRNLYALL